MRTRHHDIRIGCCGFPVGHAKYFQRFRLVEVQQTFYQPTRSETLARWRKQAPSDFEFTLKAWQLITHTPSSPTYRRLRQAIPERESEQFGAFRPTPEVEHAWKVTLECARQLDARIIVFQCPPSFTPEDPHIDNRRQFFTHARAGSDTIKLAWEPRGPWQRHTVANLCRELELIPIVDPFKHAPYSEFPRYFRLHGVTGYRYRYTDEDLRRLLHWSRNGAYCLFNNIAMAEDATRFARLTEGAR